MRTSEIFRTELAKSGQSFEQAMIETAVRDIENFQHSANILVGNACIYDSKYNFACAAALLSKHVKHDMEEVRMSSEAMQAALAEEDVY